MTAEQLVSALELAASYQGIDPAKIPNVVCLAAKGMINRSGLSLQAFARHLERAARSGADMKAYGVFDLTKLAQVLPAQAHEKQVLALPAGPAQPWAKAQDWKDVPLPLALQCMGQEIDEQLREKAYIAAAKDLKNPSRQQIKELAYLYYLKMKAYED